MKADAFFARLFQDARYAVRVMAANPLSRAMTGLSLTLGIGAKPAIALVITLA
jgi:hypothetical protein